MTPNQRIFADEYIKTRNATRAYMAAYPRIKSEKTASVNGARLLANAKILEYIDTELERMHDDTIADAREIMQYYTKVIRGQEKDQLLDLNGMPTDVKTRVTDRNAAAKQLAKMLGVESSIDSAKLKLDQEKAKREAQAEEQKQSSGALPAILEAVKRID